MFPDSYKKEFAKTTSISRFDVEKWIEKVKSLNESERNDIGKAVAENALNVLKSVPKDIFKEIQSYDAKNDIWFYRYKIKNSGTKEVNSIKIDFSSSGLTSSSKGVYSINRPGASLPVSNKFERMIDLGSLLPSQEINLIVWLTENITTGWQAETRVIHPNGFVVVEYPVKVTGFAAWLNESGFFIALVGLVGFLLIVVSVLVAWGKGIEIGKTLEAKKHEPGKEEPASAKEEAASATAALIEEAAPVTTAPIERKK